MITVQPLGEFSLRESAMFGFGQRHDTVFDGTLRMAFCLDESFEPVGLAVTQPEAAVIVDGPAEAVSQLSRALSLDIDGRGFAEVGRRDPVIGRLQALAPGLRPPLFHSAYEATAWCVLSARRPVRQMQAVREQLSTEHGTVFELAGRQVAAFPTPSALLRVAAFPGLDETKVDRLHAVARAALDGWLDTPGLRALEPADARHRLETLPGIGPFSSSLVVVRALGHADVLPVEEPRSLAVIGDLYELGRPATEDELVKIATTWAPYRTWALVLARAASGRVRPPSAGAASSR